MQQTVEEPGRGTGFARLFKWLQPRAGRRGSVRLASLSYRYLARRLANDHGGQGRGALLVLSGACQPEVIVEHAMMLAAALAAEVKARVLLVDGDLRDGVMTARFGLTGEPGLIELIQGDRDMDQLLRATARENILLLPVGAGDGHVLPGEHDRIPQVVADLRAAGNFVLLLQGEIGSDTRYLSFVRTADTVLLVAEEGFTRIDQIEEAEALFTIHDVDQVKLLLSGSGSTR